MSTFGSFNIIIKNKRVLLVRRRDVPFWDLPGGGREQGESNLNCLRRETFEETGLLIKDEHEMGHFINNDLHDEQVTYRSSIAGGNFIKSGAETKDLRFFPINHLPFNLISHRKQQIILAFKNEQVTKIIRDPLFICIYKKVFNKRR